MIRSITFDNFYSFKERQEIDFTANKKDSYDYFNSPKGDQITKVASFIGANASGKTNVIRLFGFLGYFLTNLNRNGNVENIFIPYSNFFNNKKPTNIEIVFEIKENIFTYKLVLKENSVNKEILIVKEIKKGAQPVTLFKREKDNILELNKRYFKNLKPSILPRIREDISFIPFLKSLYDIEVINTLIEYFNNFYTNINEIGQHNIIPYQIDAFESYERDKEIKEKTLDVMKNFDLGLTSIEIEKEVKKGSAFTDYMVSGIHTTSHGDKRLPFLYESRGTQSVFFLMTKILKALKYNGVAIIDEIELGLHPEALNKIITYFIDENADGHAQLIFSSLSLASMNKLDMHQIYLTEKNNDGESIVKRLNKIDGVRSDDNFLNKYLAGKYGAFPNIKI